jgi:DMSO/TMAO reductase YedYZ molybdopterin-dependent catalytic subunit
VLLPRGRSYGNGPNDFQINRTAAAARIDPALTGDRWRLQLLGGPQPLVLDRVMLAAMPHHTVDLPIACVEGWSTVETWTGIRLADLAAAAGRPEPGSAVVSSLERFGAFNYARLQRNQVLNPDALLAFQVNGADLSLDHGYPVRIVVPALPGVHCTKWVASIEFRDA